MPTDINTISAWAFLISTLVSALTGFFIVQTFQLQAKVAHQQSKITALEIERRIMEKRPLFFAERVENDIGKHESAKDYGKYELKLLRNDVYDFRLTHKFSDDLEKLEVKIEDNVWTFPDGMIEDTIIHFYYTVERSKLTAYETSTSVEDQDLKVTIYLEYKDALDNEYTQIITTSHGYIPYNHPAKSPSVVEAFKRLRV